MHQLQHDAMEGCDKGANLPWGVALRQPVQIVEQCLDTQPIDFRWRASEVRIVLHVQVVEPPKRAQRRVDPNQPVSGLGIIIEAVGEGHCG